MLVVAFVAILLAAFEAGRRWERAESSARSRYLYRVLVEGRPEARSWWESFVEHFE
jgi:hypothetical protein